MSRPPALASLRYLLPALIFAGIVSLRKTFDTDLHWHLAVGKLALTNPSTLDRDPFSFTVFGAPWIYKDLVAEVLLYLAYAASGYVGLMLLKAGVILSMAGAVYYRLSGMPATGVDDEQGRGASFLVGLGALSLGLQYRLTERPLLFSLALFPWILVVFERFLADSLLARPWNWRRHFVVPLGLLWLWAQLHREAMVGLVMVLGLALYLVPLSLLSLEKLGQVRVPRKTVLAAWSLFVAACLLLLVNPSGSQFYRTTLALSGNAELQGLLNEWRSYPISDMLQFYPGPVVISGMGGLCICYLLLRGPLFHAAFLLIWWLIFAYQTQRSIRWLPFLCALSATALLTLSQRVLQGGRVQQLAAKAAYPLLCVLVPLALLLTNRVPIGIGELEGQYPQAALQFAKVNGLHEKVVNASGFGGYVIWHGWPQFKVSIDGRIDTVYPPPIVVRASKAQKDREAFVQERAQDGADWVLASNRPGKWTHRFLNDDPAWALVFKSEAALIYVKREAYPALVGAIERSRSSGIPSPH